MKVKGVEHVAIAARDSRAMVEWYCRVLGFRVLADNGQERPTCLVGGETGAILEIMPDNSQERANPGWLDPGIRHIALEVDDFDAAYQALQDAGVEMAAPGSAMGGGRLANFPDLEGNFLQIVARERPLR